MKRIDPESQDMRFGMGKTQMPMQAEGEKAELLTKEKEALND